MHVALGEEELFFFPCPYMQHCEPVVLLLCALLCRLCIAALLSALSPALVLLRQEHGAALVVPSVALHVTLVSS